MTRTTLAEKPVPKTTIKQKRVAKKLVEAINGNQPYSKGQIVLDAGYSLHKSYNPQDVLRAPGVIYELEKLGFSEQKAKEVVGGILGDDEEKADTRLKAAEIVFKVHGTYAPEKHLNVSVNIKADPKTLALAKEFEEKLNSTDDETGTSLA